jgi:hypothetical protein
MVRDAVERVTRHVEPASSLLVLPEGAIINYLARRAGAIPYLLFTPPAVDMFGEQRIVAALEARPPDFVALVPRPVKSFGRRGLGIDYGLEIARWIEPRYVEVTPSPRPGTGMRLFRRRPPG